MADAAAAAADPHIRSNERAFLREVLATEAGAVTRFAARLAAGEDTGIHAALDLFEGCKGHVVVSGMGKSGLVGAKISATLSSLGQPSHFVHPAEAVHGDLGSIRPDDVVLLLSWSGETQEVVALASILKMDGIPTVGMSGKAKSSLARACAVHVDLGDLTEACPLNLAPTASTSVMLAVGDALALVACRQRGFSRDDFAQVHPAGALGRRLCSVSDLMRRGDQLRIAPQDVTIRQALVEHQRAGRRTGAIMAVDQGGLLAGLFTDSDLARLLEQRREAQLDRPLCEVMTPHPKTISSDAPLADACKLLADHHISELPVIDDRGHPVGLIDITDVITYMPEQRTD